MPAEWLEVRARSSSADGHLCCGDCYMAWSLTGFACAKHITPEERSALDAKLGEALTQHHPFFDFMKKGEH